MAKGHEKQVLKNSFRVALSAKNLIQNWIPGQNLFSEQYLFLSKRYLQGSSLHHIK